MLDCAQTKFEFRVVDSEADIPAFVYLADMAYLESHFRDIPFSADKVANIAKRAISDPNLHGVFLARKGDRPQGMLYCSTGEYHIGTDVLLTTIHNINVCPDISTSVSWRSSQPAPSNNTH